MQRADAGIAQQVTRVRQWGAAAQIGALAYPCERRTPSRAIESMFGVLTSFEP